MAQHATIWPKLDKNSDAHTEMISKLERQFGVINQLLYTTNVPNAELEHKVLPYIADDVVFKDPWQEGGDKKMYSVGMKGFHNMLHFDFDTYQLGVKLNDDGTAGRCMIDGVMNLKQFSWIYTFPLRTIVVYDFRMLSSYREEEPRFEIFHHEEMWSYTELIDGIPGVGWVYKNMFRPAFGHLFFGASYLSCLISDFLAEKKQKFF